MNSSIRVSTACFALIVVLTLPLASAQQSGRPEINLAEDRQGRELELADQLSKAVKAEFDKAVSEITSSFPNVFQLRDAAKAFTDKFSDAEAVTFLKKVPELTDLSKNGRAEQQAAFIGLALLSDKHDTASFLKAGIGDRSTLRSRHCFAGITFLPGKDARTIAETVALDIEQTCQTRIQCLFLLRAVGDRETLAKLAKMERDLEPPAVW